MPPQPGLFSVPYGMGHKSRSNTYAGADVDMAYHHGPVAGPSSRSHGEGGSGKKEKRRKDQASSSKLGKEVNDRREDSRYYSESLHALLATAKQLTSLRPEENSLYNLRLYPISYERAALLAQLEYEERHLLECAESAHTEERERVEDEWKRGRERVRERLLEGIEERRRRAREEKDGEGTTGDAALDSHSRPPITRKLRNKMGTSPPPTPLGAPGVPLPVGGNAISHLPITTGPFLNPHSLSVDEIPSPFPLALTATSNPTAANQAAAGAPNGRKRQRGAGPNNHLTVGGLGKSVAMLNQAKDADIEFDLGEIRRGNKRRRAVVQAAAAKA